MFQKLYFFIKYYLNNIYLKPVAGIPASDNFLKLNFLLNTI